MSYLHLSDYYLDDNGKPTLPSTGKCFFDHLCHEFSNQTIEEKALILANLIYHGFDLPSFIKTYMENKSPHVLSTLSESLLFYINTLRWGEIYHITDDTILENMDEMALAKLLQDELIVRYTCWESLNEHKLIFSNWGNEIERKIADICGDSKEKFIEIFTTADFSNMEIAGNENTKKYDKILTGLAGECETMKVLALKGWVPSLAYNNCPTFDIFCFNPITERTTMIQVKTIKDKETQKVSSFPIMGNRDKREIFYKNIAGPFIFIHIDKENNFSHYILSRNQFIELSSKIEKDYEYDKQGNKKNLKPAPMAMPRKCIEEYKDQWNNIWK